MQATLGVVRLQSFYSCFMVDLNFGILNPQKLESPLRAVVSLAGVLDLHFAYERQY
jgi:hypothetical protein